MRKKLPRIAVADLSDAIGRFGPDSPETDRIRTLYANIEGFREYADSFLKIQRSLGNSGVDCGHVVHSASQAQNRRLIVRAGREPGIRGHLNWLIGVTLIRAGVWVLGQRASFRQFDLRDRAPKKVAVHW